MYDIREECERLNLLLVFCLQPNFTGLASQGSETGGSRGNVGGQSSAGNQTRSGQPFQSAPQVVQVPLSAAIPVPSLHSVLKSPSVAYL
jgi:hypothetical protein